MTCALIPKNVSSPRKYRIEPLSDDAEFFLTTYPVQIRALARATHDFIEGQLPRVEHKLDRSARMVVYGYGEGYKNVVFTMILSHSGVKLGVYRGAELEDPKRLMTGSGKIHRHVQLRSAEDLEKPGLKQLAQAALSAWRERSHD